MRARTVMSACGALALALTACGSSVGPRPAAHPASSWPSRPPTALARPAHPVMATSPVTPSVPPTATSNPSLPTHGQAIIGHVRVVAYYGAAGNPRLGVLGSAAPEQIAQSILARARGFARYGLPVQPAMELIATVAQGSPQPDGSYSAPIPGTTIRRYLAVAHRYRMLLLLDLQPGRSTFLTQAKALGDVLLDPSVGLGLDPEWKVTGTQRPGDGLIGSSGSGDINATVAYLSSLVTAHRLPHKLVVVHEFTASMLPDRSSIAARPGVELTFHADGFGTVARKINVFDGLRFPGHPTGTGIKLFLRQDARLMSPAEVMRLTPRPDVITYQ